MNKTDLKVFPIRPNAKAPALIVGWQLAATRSTDQLKTWQVQFPGCNWGAHCEDMIVLDVDAQKGGEETLSQLEAEHGPLPDTLSAETPSGGRHIFLRHGGGVPNSVEKLGPGVDVRSTGGYVLVQPSTIGDRAYKWVHDDHDIADAPDWLADLAGKRTAPAVDPAPEDRESLDVDEDAAVQKAVDWLSRQEPAIEGQGGDYYTYTVCCKLRDFGVPIGRMLEALEAWNARCEPPWESAELYRKAVNAINYAQNPPATHSNEAVLADFEAVETGKPDSGGASKPNSDIENDIDLYGPADIELFTVLNSDYLVKGWLDRGVQAQVFGPWGAGKTFCTLHLGAHIAAGEPWFENRVRQGGVLYAGYEGAKAMRKRLYALRMEYDWPWEKIPFRVIDMNEPLAQKNGAGQKRLSQAVGHFPGGHPALIIIDPLRDALGGSEDPELTSPLRQYTKYLSKMTNAAVLIVHHPGHTDGSRGRGDSAIDAAMDTIINVDGQKISAKKQRDDAKQSLYYRLKVVQLGEDQDGDAVTTCVVEQVKDNPMDPTLTTPQAELLAALTAKAGEDRTITKRQLQHATDLDAKTRDELVEALERKHYLVLDGNKYRIQDGIIDEFETIL